MVFIMKKVLPCLAVAALMVTGCAPSTKVNEKKFTEEVTNYGVFLNNNVKFEGNATMGEMEIAFSLLSESDGENIKLHATISYLNGEAAGASMQAVLIGEVKEEKFNGNAYMNEGSNELDGAAWTRPAASAALISAGAPSTVLKRPRSTSRWK